MIKESKERLGNAKSPFELTVVIVTLVDDISTPCPQFRSYFAHTYFGVSGADPCKFNGQLVSATQEQERYC